jgi:hypothetical protein
MFMVEGGLIYLDRPADGGFAAYEDGFSILESAGHIIARPSRIPDGWIC